MGKIIAVVSAFISVPAPRGVLITSAQLTEILNIILRDAVEPGLVVFERKRFQGRRTLACIAFFSGKSVDVA